VAALVVRCQPEVVRRDHLVRVRGGVGLGVGVRVRVRVRGRVRARVKVRSGEITADLRSAPMRILSLAYLVRVRVRDRVKGSG